MLGSDKNMILNYGHSNGFSGAKKENIIKIKFSL
jgi:hypothetical protein